MAKYSIKFNDEDFNNYLEHHGIKGQKWGVRRSLEELGYKVNQRRKRRRHDRILKDPRLLAKHINEFSQEEIDKRVKELKNAELVRKSANLPVKLKGKKARWAKDPNKLEKHRNDLTDEEFEEAMKRLNDDQKIHEAKMKQMSRLNDYVAKGADFIKSISGIATNTENIRSKIEKWQNLDKEKAEAELDRQLKVEKDRMQIELLAKNKEEKEIANRNAAIKGYAEYLDTKKKTEIAEKSYKADTKRKNAESKANIAEVKARTDKIKSETRRTRAYKVRSGNKKSTSAKIVKGLPAISSKSFMNFSVKQLIKNNKPVTTEDIAGYLPDRSESPWMETRIEDLMKVRHSDIFSEDILGIQVDDNFLQHHGIKGQKWGVKNGPPYPLGSGSPKKSTKINNDHIIENPKKELVNMGFNIRNKGNMEIAELNKEVKDEYGQTRNYKMLININEFPIKAKMSNNQLNGIKDVINNPLKIDKKIRNMLAEDNNFINNIWAYSDAANLSQTEKKEYVRKYFGKHMSGGFNIDINATDPYYNMDESWGYTPNPYKNIINFTFDNYDLNTNGEHKTTINYDIINKKIHKPRWLTNA